jgi:hypothetical protein
LKLPLLQQADSVPSSSSCTSALGNPYGYVEHSAPIIGPQDAGNLQIKTIGHSWKGHECQGIFRNQVILCSISVTATNISLFFSGGVVHVYNRKVVFLYGMIFFNNTATTAAT